MGDDLSHALYMFVTDDGQVSNDWLGIEREGSQLRFEHLGKSIGIRCNLKSLIGGLVVGLCGSHRRISRRGWMHPVVGGAHWLRRWGSLTILLVVVHRRCSIVNGSASKDGTFLIAFDLPSTTDNQESVIATRVVIQSYTRATRDRVENRRTGTSPLNKMPSFFPTALSSLILSCLHRQNSAQDKM